MQGFFSRSEALSGQSGPKSITLTIKYKHLWLVLGILLILLAASPIVASYYPASTPANSSTPGASGAGSSATPNCSNPCIVVIENSEFNAPGNGATIVVKAGTQVIWKNSDSTDHTSTSDVGSSFAWNTGILVPGESSAPVTFATPGTFTYHCEIHPMNGEIIVVSG
jgi:plastocyanin